MKGEKRKCVARKVGGGSLFTSTGSVGVIWIEWYTVPANAAGTLKNGHKTIVKLVLSTINHDAAVHAS